MEENKRLEIVPGYFVGDTVILKEETDWSNKNKIKIGAIGIVSMKDNKDTLKGWAKVDLEDEFRQEIDKMSPERVSELYDSLAAMGKIKNADMLDEIAKKSIK
tara:strand:- start:104 stop:412 length:309 start_codon:yes stop_codon:yes gene_type:complete